MYTSSSSVYGSNKKIPYSTDDKVDNPVSLYAATRKSNELMAHAYSKLYNIQDEYIEKYLAEKKTESDSNIGCKKGMAGENMMKEKLRVAMFGQKRLSREGGIEIVVKELCTRMARDGCQVTCYNRSGHHVSGAEYDRKIEYEGICQKSVPTIEKKGLAAVSSSAFAALYSALGKYDVIHIHAEGPAFFAWLPKMFGKRVIVTIHGIDWQREKWQSGFGSKFIRQGEKNAVKYADEIVVLSKGVQDYFRETYGRETHFIPNGVSRPVNRKANLITDRFGLTSDSYILFLGRLVPEKGIRYLVEAFKNVKTEKRLVIAGGSSDTDSFARELKDLAKDDHRIIFTGFVQGNLLDELYSNAYIYTLPSDLEGMPLSLLEAMSYGNCCLERV